jgi:hypothetical protein
VDDLLHDDAREVLIVETASITIAVIAQEVAMMGPRHVQTYGGAMSSGPVVRHDDPLPDARPHHHDAVHLEGQDVSRLDAIQETTAIGAGIA